MTRDLFDALPDHPPPSASPSKSAQRHSAFLATLPCLRCFVQFRLRTVPARPVSIAAAIPAAEARRRAPYVWTAPLCDHHAFLPAHPDLAALFWDKLGIDLPALCAALFDHSGDRARAEAAFARQANRARRRPPGDPFKPLHPDSPEARKILTRFQKEADIRV